MLAHQILTVKMISMNSMDLRDEILNEVENNPALEITFDPMSNVKSEHSESYSRHSKSGTNEDSDTFQKILENQEDSRETLQEHLLSQLNMLRLPENETEVCRALIQNLDSRGYHILAPDSLKTSDGKSISLISIKKCMNIVQHLDPAGICCKNIEESLKIQADLKIEEEKSPSDHNKLILFLLNGHFDFLDPLIPAKIREKIIRWLKNQQQKKLANMDQKNSEAAYENFDEKYVTEEKILHAINFIRQLNPNPAAEFSSSRQTQFITPEVKISVEKGSVEEDKLEKGIVKISENEYLKILPLNDILPQIAISETFKNAADSLEKDSESREKMKKSLSSANVYINSLNYRNQVVYNTIVRLAAIQKDFFIKGPGNLVPLTQKKLASLQKISESTVSRMASNKFLICDWGTYPLKSLFSHSIHSGSRISSEEAKLRIAKIISEYDEKGEKISDLKITELLNNEGFGIARRTVQKYRSLLNINSSFYR